MSQKTKLILRIVAIIVALLAVGMEFQFVIIPSVNAYKFWFMVGSFILLLITNQ
jgi:hypothetical protein